jgi:hypothetical protein
MAGENTVYRIAEYCDGQGIVKELIQHDATAEIWPQS